MNVSEIIISIKFSGSNLLFFAVAIFAVGILTVEVKLSNALLSVLCRASATTIRTPATRTIVGIEIIIMIVLISGPNLLFFAVKIAVGITVEVFAEGITVEVFAEGIPIEVVAVEIVAVVHRHVSAGLSSNITPATTFSIKGSISFFPSIPVTA